VVLNPPTTTTHKPLGPHGPTSQLLQAVNGQASVEDGSVQDGGAGRRRHGKPAEPRKGAAEMCQCRREVGDEIHGPALLQYYLWADSARAQFDVALAMQKPE
jgi:hypothetical protein